jgi:hypothetical protein
MLDLRSPDPHRAAADRRVALVAGGGAVVLLTFVAVLAGAGAKAVWVGGTLAFALFPWLLAFNGRPYLLDGALAGKSFAGRGERAGIWATAPAAGALLAPLAVGALGVGTVPGLLLCLAGAAGYTALIARSERAYERAIYLDLTVLELRFQAIADARPRRRRMKGTDPFSSRAG